MGSDCLRCFQSISGNVKRVAFCHARNFRTSQPVGYVLQLVGAVYAHRNKFCINLFAQFGNSIVTLYDFPTHKIILIFNKSNFLRGKLLNRFLFQLVYASIYDANLLRFVSCLFIIINRQMRTVNIFILSPQTVLQQNLFHKRTLAFRPSRPFVLHSVRRGKALFTQCSTHRIFQRHTSLPLVRHRNEINMQMRCALV